jgi:exosortase
VTRKPARETIRSTEWLVALVAVLGTLGFVYYPLMAYSAKEWLKPDYSHGFLVPLFSVYLAWRWREWAPEHIRWPNPWGLAFVAGAALIYVGAGASNFAKEWLQGLSLVLSLCGVSLLLGGWTTLKWLWPCLAFLMFMFPLPYSVEIKFGWYLQKIAALSSSFVLQTIGYPTYLEGVVIHVSGQALEVEKACSGLSMLLTFLALSTGMAMLVKRPALDRTLILLSAVPVAVLANVIRISLTGILFVEGGRELGEKVFHDFAGWLMMPFALLILWLELKVLDWVLLEDLGQASREEVIKMNTNPAHLFMHALTGVDPAQQQKPPKK